MTALVEDEDRYSGKSDGEVAALHEVEDDLDVANWVPPGPVSRGYYNDDTSRFCLVMGPVGSGKTSTCVMKRIRMASLMPPNAEGWRRDYLIVVRDTYRSAAKSTLISWQEWFPKNFPGSTWTGGDDRPVTHVLRGVLRDGSKFEAVTEVVGLNGNRIEAVMRGKNFSSAWMNEMTDLPRDAVTYLSQRLGRFPSMKDLNGQQPFSQLIGDFNAPDTDHWLKDMCIDKPLPGLTLHQLPPAMLRAGEKQYRVNPLAENVKALPQGYYERMCETEEDWYIRRFVMNEWGYSRDGLPVYADYFDERAHVARTNLLPEPGLPAMIGIDGSTAGLRPAAVIFQLHGDGGIRVTDEFVPGQGYGASRFFEGLKALLDSRYRLCPRLMAWTDPASQYGGDREGGQLSFADIGTLMLGIPLMIPFNGSNEIGLRTQAVKNELKPGGLRPPLLVSPHCKFVIRGFASGYRFKKKPPNSAVPYELLPDKASVYSDPHDALQYGIGGLRGTRSVVGEAAGGWQAGAKATGWSSQQGGGSPWAGRKNDFDVTRM